MIFLVSSGKMIFLFSENVTLFFRRKMKDDLSQKNTWKYDIFLNTLKRSHRYMIFPVPSGKMAFLFLENMIFLLGEKFDLICKLYSWSYSTMKNLQYPGTFSPQELYLDVPERQLRKIFDHQEMGYNSKNIRTVAKRFQCRSRTNLSERACQKSCESIQNWGSYGQKENTYFKGTFPSNSAIKIVLSKHFVLIMRIIIQIKINMDVIRQERPREGPILNLIKRIK